MNVYHHPVRMMATVVTMWDPINVTVNQGLQVKVYIHVLAVIPFCY